MEWQNSLEERALDLDPNVPECKSVLLIPSIMPLTTLFILHGPHVPLCKCQQDYSEDSRDVWNASSIRLALLLLLLLWLYSVVISIVIGLENGDSADWSDFSITGILFYSAQPVSSHRKTLTTWMSSAVGRIPSVSVGKSYHRSMGMQIRLEYSTDVRYRPLCSRPGRFRKENSGLQSQLCAQCLRHGRWGRVEKYSPFLSLHMFAESQ